MSRPQMTQEGLLRRLFQIEKMKRAKRRSFYFELESLASVFLYTIGTHLSNISTVPFTSSLPKSYLVSSSNGLSSLTTTTTTTTSHLFAHHQPTSTKSTDFQQIHLEVLMKFTPLPKPLSQLF